MLGKDIRELVIVKMEEHTPFGDKSGEKLLAGGDVLSEVKPIYSYIDATLHEAADEALQVIPVHRLTPIAIDLLTDEHLGRKYVALNIRGKRYYQATSGDVSVGSVYGKTAAYAGGKTSHNGALLIDVSAASITFTPQGEGSSAVTAYRWSAGDIVGQTDYYCFASLSGVFYYTTDVPASVGMDVYKDDFTVPYASVTSVTSSSSETPVVFFGGWVTDDGEEIYTLGPAMPKLGDTYYTYTNSAMTVSDEIVEMGLIAVATAAADANDELIGTITKPVDWLRLHTLRMNGWSRPVHVVVRPDQPLYNQQFSRWQRGTAQKPVVIDDGKALHYFSQPASATMEQIDNLLYVPHFNEYTDYPADVAEAIALITAGKVYEIFGMKEQIEIFIKEIESVITTMRL